ncbi:MAG: DUF4229 domain-containing protein [Brachybacterium sp.]|nr:DUF4229 domain-containing protein [Brachybacterium sp.]
MRDVLVYSVLRLALFAGTWWLLYMIGVGFWLAGIAAALVSMLVSILVLRRQRDRVATHWQAADERRRARKGEPVDDDADAEDEAVEEGRRIDG